MLVIFDEFLKLNSNAGNKRFQRELLLGNMEQLSLMLKVIILMGKV